MIEVSVDQYTFELAHKDAAYILNGQIVDADVQQINDQLWHIIYKNHSYKVFIHKVIPETKEVIMSINGKRKSVKVRTRMEKLLADLGLEHTLHKKLNTVTAPMPGLIHRLLVKVGDQVQKGDQLLILEAMKMENVIKSPGEGVVNKIHISPKDSVEKNELLISFQ